MADSAVGSTAEVLVSCSFSVVMAGSPDDDGDNIVRGGDKDVAFSRFIMARSSGMDLALGVTSRRQMLGNQLSLAAFTIARSWSVSVRSAFIASPPATAAIGIADGTCSALQAAAMLE